MIIDIHSHLGNILYPAGGRLIWEKGVRKRLRVDLITLSEWGLHKSMGGLEKPLYRLLGTAVTRAERARNFTATLENMRASLDAAGVAKTACMPIAPHVTFDDLEKAHNADDGIIPFTSVDFSGAGDIQAKLNDHVLRGARGLKLHPIIQKIPPDSPESMAAVEAFAPHGLPVLTHCGISSYYTGREKTRLQDPDQGRIEGVRRLAAAFPRVGFIAGHAGLFQVKEVMGLLGGLANVSVDVSFQPPAIIRELIRVFGPERVLYASDWPYGNREPAIRAVRRACQGDRSVERKVFSGNALKLLKFDG